MNPATIVNLALTAIQAILGLIAEIKGASGLTDDQKATATQQLLAANDALYGTLKSALMSGTTTTTPAPPTAS